MTTHTQCRLERNGSYQVSWIPSEFARKGRKIGLKEDGDWEEGWVVARVGSTQDSKVVDTRSRDYRAHRKATDV